MAFQLKFFTLFFLVFTSTIVHNMEPNDIFKKGTFKISTENIDSENIEVTIEYDLKKRWYVPIKDLKGQLKQKIPAIILKEETYKEIRDKGKVDYEDVTLTFLRRETVNGYTDCYVVRMDRDKKDFSLIVFYHPTVPSTGWVRLELTYYDAPVVGEVSVSSNLKRIVYSVEKR